MMTEKGKSVVPILQNIFQWSGIFKVCIDRILIFWLYSHKFSVCSLTAFWIFLICSRFGDTFVGQVIVAGIFLTWAMFKHISLLSIGKVLYFFLILISGTMLQIGAMIVVGSLSFWLNKSTKIGEVFYYEIRSLIHYPLSIYPVWIRYLLTYLLPWAFINYYPALLLLAKGNSVIDYVLGGLSPFVGVGVFAFSIVFFYKGLQVYCSPGN